MEQGADDVRAGLTQRGDERKTRPPVSASLEAALSRLLAPFELRMAKLEAMVLLPDTSKQSARDAADRLTMLDEPVESPATHTVLRDLCAPLEVDNLRKELADVGSSQGRLLQMAIGLEDRLAQLEGMECRAVAAVAADIEERLEVALSVRLTALEEFQSTSCQQLELISQELNRLLKRDADNLRTAGDAHSQGHIKTGSREERAMARPRSPCDRDEGTPTVDQSRDQRTGADCDRWLSGALNIMGEELPAQQRNWKLII